MPTATLRNDVFHTQSWQEERFLLARCRGHIAVAHKIASCLDRFLCSFQFLIKTSLYFGIAACTRILDCKFGMAPSLLVHSSSVLVHSAALGNEESASVDLATGEALLALTEVQPAITTNPSQHCPAC